ncbi:TM2 domain-containing protein [Candidatus Poribacteria bacterium]|nr:TM2 domain-containing protein [Candidatus Poribacteria bacterium]
MKGKILDFSIQSNSGLISGDDGDRYTFTGVDWKSEKHPARGMSVDFTTDDNNAKEIYVAFTASAIGQKEKLVAALLAIFLGGFGIHKFYLGYKKQAFILLGCNTVGFLLSWMLLVSTAIFVFLIPHYILFIIGVIEGIIYLVKSDEEFEQTYVVGRKEWF